MNYEKTKELAKSGHQLVALLGTQNGMHEAASLVQRMAGQLDLLAVVLKEKTNISDELLAALVSLAAVARRYLPDYDEHPEVQKADDAITRAKGGVA
ncbi:hypothetical protein FZI38_02705 [Cronobacter sakazakii]|uniref:Uncharacterized protein n=2 Tax=Cronobacter sakazakii TaxID=28141 RepID=A0AAN6AXW4_CROSK|nr:hypothetical protein [Cronobacter sakazakii]EGT5722650.1 hypothetical protein [Cronobacter sakazakii]EJG0810306.1 hypothetical protein [Cronobacter sakazakii]KAB0881113.1 hypothetical protein FZI38_02705 [Cronobacter sakazakii]PPX93690.1 hypothetical protein C3D77_06085 [Cronobacter sakazakii]PQY75770.1 hypothetical protein C5944_08735 [Cronobacter sakazakii]